MSTLLQKVQSGELNPIIYMPMTSGADAHINYGYGGNFSVNGTLATADRGPNQDNCVASKDFLTNTTHLSSTSVGASASKVCTLVFNAKSPLVSVASQDTVFYVTDGSAANHGVRVQYGSNLITFRFNVAGTGGTRAAEITIPEVNDRESQYAITLNTANVNDTVVFKNGVDVTSSVILLGFTDDLIGFNGPTCRIGARSFNTTVTQFDGSIGEFWFDTTYTPDLMQFWDTDNNSPKSVRQVLTETGANPLIAMPISASNPTKNYGSGGDFTLNGGGLTGARSMSEYIARSMLNSTTSVQTNYLSNSYLTGVLGNWSTIIAVKAFSTSSLNYASILHTGATSRTFGLNIYLDLSEHLYIYLNNIRVAKFTKAVLTVDWSLFYICYDGTEVKSIWQKSDGTLTTASMVLASQTIDLSVGYIVGGANYLDDDFNGHLSSHYLTSDYIDFSQEANRNLFVNQLGYVRSLDEPIAQGLIPEPLIYLKFDDPDNLGKNSGTGSDFTVNGTVTAGADFTL